MTILFVIYLIGLTLTGFLTVAIVALQPGSSKLLAFVFILLVSLLWPVILIRALYHYWLNHRA